MRKNRFEAPLNFMLSLRTRIKLFKFIMNTKFDATIITKLKMQVLINGLLGMAIQVAVLMFIIVFHIQILSGCAWKARMNAVKSGINSVKKLLSFALNLTSN